MTLSLKKGSLKIGSKVESAYKPDRETLKVIHEMSEEFQKASDVQTKKRDEFNGLNLIEEINRGQKAFNSYIEPIDDDPDTSWRANTVRPVTRNKLISIAAHVLVTVLYPSVFAQNDNDEEDIEAASAMRLLVEYNIENSKYQKEFLNVVIAMLTDPFAVMHVNFARVLREIKDRRDENGKWIMKEIVDEALSGFIAEYVPAKEFLFTNFYENDVQRQRSVFRHKSISYQEARRKYGNHPDFVYVNKGMVTIFDEGNDEMFFYNVPDTELQNDLVWETTWYNYHNDTEVTAINHIIVTDHDGELKHPDHKYPFAKGGYEPLNNGKCFAYFSAARKIGSDQDIVDTMYNMVIDGTFMSLMPPKALYGTEDADGSVMIPGAITSFKDPNTKLEDIGPRSDIRAGMEAINMVERSISESSQDSSRAGLRSQGPEQTAREVLSLEKNAQIALGMFGKMIGFMVEDIGNLMIPLIIEHMTVADMQGILSPTQRLKYSAYLVHGKVVDGKKSTARVQFSDEFLDFENMSEEDIMNMSYSILEEEGIDGETKLLKVNPIAFRNRKYSIKVNPDELSPKSKALEKALNLELYDRAIANPTVDQEMVTRDFLFDSYKEGEGYKYMRKMKPNEVDQMNQARIAGNGKQAGINQNTVGQLTGNNSLGVAASSEA